MKTKILYGIWGFLFVMCYALGHMTEPDAAQSGALTVIGVLFFIPGVWLLADGMKRQDKKAVLAIRWISIGSLSLTVAAFLGNLASVTASDAVGVVLNEILLFVSVPLGCMQFSLVSLFLWACLLFSTFIKKR